ncbi:hypothetical protein Dimus_017956 [Dionaea muscipula]
MPGSDNRLGEAGTERRRSTRGERRSAGEHTRRATKSGARAKDESGINELRSMGDLSSSDLVERLSPTSDSGNRGVGVGDVRAARLATAKAHPCQRLDPYVPLRMAEFRKEAVTYIEQGHVRVGMETVADPAFHVTRNMQDFITWVDSSSFRRKVLQYHQKLDDYDVMA